MKDDDFWALLVILIALIIGCGVVAKFQRNQLHDLQRRVGQLESERR